MKLDLRKGFAFVANLLKQDEGSRFVAAALSGNMKRLNDIIYSGSFQDDDGKLLKAVAEAGCAPGTMDFILQHKSYTTKQLDIAVEAACLHAHRKTAESVLKHGATPLADNFYPLKNAIMSNHPDTIKWCLAQGSDAGFWNNYALCLATREHKNISLQTLIDERPHLLGKIESNLFETLNQVESAALFAVEYGNPLALIILHEEGLDTRKISGQMRAIFVNDPFAPVGDTDVNAGSLGIGEPASTAKPEDLKMCEAILDAIENGKPVQGFKEQILKREALKKSDASWPHFLPYGM